MTRNVARRCPAPNRLLVGLSAGLLFAGSHLGIGNLGAAEHGRSAEVANHPEGVRYVYVTTSPAKEAFLERLKREGHDLCGPTFTNLVDGKHPAVVRIDVEGTEDVVYHGSGTLVAATAQTGLVLTNWHVVRDRAGEVSVRFPDGFVARATVVKSDKTWDLAALSIARPHCQPVRLSDAIPEIGDTLTVAGYGGGTYRQSTGRLLQFCAPGMDEPQDILEVTTGARSGDSGGPIFAQDGTLAGVLFGSISGTTNGSHAGRVRQFLEPLLGKSAVTAGTSSPHRLLYETGSRSKF